MQTPTELLEKFYQTGKKKEEAQDMESALRCYKWAADRGCPNSQLSLGKMYETGKGTPVNFQEAFQYYQKSADQGNPAAHYKLAYLYHLGNGTEKNHSKSFAHCKKSAEGGYALAQDNLGLIFYNGDKDCAIDIDLEEAYKYFKLAADQGNENSQYFFGRACFKGDGGVPQNFTLAREYLEKINYQNLLCPGHCILGTIYYKGLEIAPDKKKAQNYFTNAISTHDSIDGPEDLAIAQVYLGMTYLDEDCGEKKIDIAQGYFSLALLNKPQDSPILKKVLDIIEWKMNQLDIGDLLLLTRLIVGKISTDGSIKKPTYIIQTNRKDLFFICAKVIKNRFAEQETLTAEEQTILDELLLDSQSLKDFTPKQALELAKEELKKNDKTIRINYLRDYLSIPDKTDRSVHIECMYYLGLCHLAHLLDNSNDHLGLNFIRASARNEFPAAMQYMTFYSPPEKGSNQAEILLQAGMDAQKEGMYQIAKFHYSKARGCISAKEKNRLKNCLLQMMVLELTLGDLAAAKKHLAELSKIDPNDSETRYRTMELYVKEGKLAEAIQILRDNTLFLKRLSQEDKEKDTWQYILTCVHELSLADNLFNKNDMQQGIRRVRSVVDKGYAQAKVKLALCHLEGWGVERNLQEAWQCFNAIKTDPAAAYYLGILSICKMGSDMDEKKLQDYFNNFSSEYITEYLLKCHSAAGLIELGDKAFEQKMYRVATMHYMRASEKEDKNTNALLKRARCHIKWTEWDMAHELIKKVLKLDPSSQEAILGALECLTLQNKLDEAVALLKNNESLYLSSIAPIRGKRSWQQSLSAAFEKNKKMETVVPLQKEVPPQIILDSPLPDIKKSTKHKRQKNAKPKSLKFWQESLLACTTIEQFMAVFYDITRDNTDLPPQLLEKMTTWVTEHAQYKSEILQKLKEKSERYKNYIDMWKIIAEEETGIAPAETPALDPVEPQPQLPSPNKTDEPISKARMSNLQQRITPREKRRINRGMDEIKRRSIDLESLEPFEKCLTRLYWFMNQQIINRNTVFGNDLKEFVMRLEELQSQNSYQWLCDTYYLFHIERKELAHVDEFHTHFKKMQSYMLRIHKMISLLEIQLLQMQMIISNTPDTLKALRSSELAQQNEHLKQLEQGLQNFQRMRKIMNDALKTSNAHCVFSSRSSVIDDLFDKLCAVSEECLLVGSAVRKSYENKQNILDTDLDFVLCNADPQKLIGLGFVKNPKITDMDVYSNKMWVEGYGFILVDVLCKPKSENWLKEDVQNRALKREMYLNRFGEIHDISEEAFFHVDNDMIGIPGNPSKRVQQDPVLLLRVVDDVLRILQNERVPIMEDATMIAIKTWTQNTQFPQHVEHVNALARKYMDKWGAVIFTSKLEEYGLLKRIFGIDSDNDPEKTAAILKKQVAKKRVFSPLLSFDAGSKPAASLGEFGLFAPGQPELAANDGLQLAGYMNKGKSK